MRAEPIQDGEARRADSRTARWVSALTPIVLVAVCLVIVARIEPAQRSEAEKRYVIPPGTAERAEAGLPLDDVLPQWITTSVGIELVVDNQDTSRHIFGPFVLDPGQSWRRQFAAQGDYAFDCSLYPVAGFTIAVEESPIAGASRVSRAVSVGWLAAALLVVATLIGALTLATMSGTVVSGLMVLPAYALPGTVAGAVAAALFALSRVADWRPVLVGRDAFTGLAAVALACAAAAIVARVLPVDRVAQPQRALPPVFLAALGAASLAWLSVPAVLAARIVVLVLGAGMLGAALVAPGSRNIASRRRLALAGFAAFLTALPLPLAALTPPSHAALAMPGLALGVAVLTWGALGPGKASAIDGGHGATSTQPRAASAAWPDGGWTARAAGGAITAVALGYLWWGGIRHLDAVSLPLWGNPTAPSVASQLRGARLWNAECAVCHDSAGSMTLGEDRAMLELLTNGRPGHPAFAYRLDLSQRGDVLNYLRSLPSPALTPATDDTDDA